MSSILNRVSATVEQLNPSGLAVGETEVVWEHLTADQAEELTSELNHEFKIDLGVDQVNSTTTIMSLADLVVAAIGRLAAPST